MYRVRLLTFLCSIWLAVSIGCGGSSGGGGGSDGDLDPGPTQQATLTGTVQGLSGGAGGGNVSPLSGATIEDRIDLDGNGTISQNERFQTESQSEGQYQLNVQTQSERNLVVSFQANGYAESHHTLQIENGGTVEVEAKLHSVDPLECRGSRCSLRDRSLVIEGLPQGVSGSGQTFNPVTEASAFPGSFEDDQGNLLISGVFATIDLEDENGNEIDQLQDPVDLEMRVPRDTWSVMRDIQSGNGQIDVPLYSFGENDGEWKRDGGAILVDGEGSTIDESQLEAIKSGNYNGAIHATGEVQHFSYWNVDWPVSSHGAIKGRIVGPNGSPAPGATVIPRGITYNGSSTPQQVGPNGTFCFEVMRSEGPNEDVDQDGTNGETQKIAIRGLQNGDVYDLGEVEVSKQQATCDEPDQAQDVGDLTLDESSKLQPRVCEFDVTVRDLQGTPVSEQTIWGYPEGGLSYQVLQNLCFDPNGGSNQQCQLSAQTDSQGKATLKVAFLDSIGIGAWAANVNSNAQSSFRYGSRSVLDCPSQGIDLTLDRGWDVFELDVSVQGKEISWTLDVGATYLFVSGQQQFKWSIFEEQSRISPPVTYGQVPQGARQGFYFNQSSGSPPSLSQGDSISISSTTTNDNGYVELYQGSAVVGQ
jgi:hypothetical protein